MKGTLNNNNQNLKIKKVLVFGTFDGIHEGHKFFLNEARSYGNQLVVAVAEDSTVKKLKGVLPNTPLPNRIKKLEDEGLADKIISGDEEIGKWKVVKREIPDVICLGYDQKELATALMRALPSFGFKLEVVIIKDYEGGKFHNTLLNRKK